MNSAIEWVNVVLFGLAALSALGSLNKMKVGETRPCMIGAVLLIAVGCAAEAIGQFSNQWDAISDTLVAGGLLALLLASQRVHTWFLERFANPIASVICLFSGAVFLGWLLSGCAVAPKPICEKPEFMVLITRNGTYYALDQNELAVLARTARRLEAGECALGPAELDGAGS
jgi:hypothetical protein